MTRKWECGERNKKKGIRVCVRRAKVNCFCWMCVISVFLPLFPKYDCLQLFAVVCSCPLAHATRSTRTHSLTQSLHALTAENRERTKEEVAHKLCRSHLMLSSRVMSHHWTWLGILCMHIAGKKIQPGDGYPAPLAQCPIESCFIYSFIYLFLDKSWWFSCESTVRLLFWFLVVL